MTSAAVAIELCSLCPIEPACERRQMLEHYGCAGHSGTPHTVNGQPYRCWLLSACDEAEKSRPA